MHHGKTQRQRITLRRIPNPREPIDRYRRSLLDVYRLDLCSNTLGSLWNQLKVLSLNLRHALLQIVRMIQQEQAQPLPENR